PCSTTRATACSTCRPTTTSSTAAWTRAPEALTDSVAFDRATGFYDRTRALAPQTMDAVVALLAAELAGRAPVLEPGVGTGRMALPVAAAGVDVIGLDLSAPMLREIVAKRDGASTDSASPDG